MSDECVVCGTSNIEPEDEMTVKNGLLVHQSCLDYAAYEV